MNDHKHSFESNYCAKYGNIHKCAKKRFEENSALKYIVFLRYPHERLLSFFKGNLRCFSKEELNYLFEKFILSENFFDLKNYLVPERLKELRNYRSHLAETRFFKPKNKAFYFHLNNLNSVWQNYFGIDHSDKYIINKTNSHQNELTVKTKIKFDDNQIQLIKLKYSNEYDDINSKLG